MAKFYCMSIDFQLILDAPDEKTAANRFLNKAIAKNVNFGWILWIGEIGFNRNKMLMLPCIPILKKIGKHTLPEDSVILDRACLSLGLNKDVLSEDFKFWLLNGEDSKKNEF